MSLGILDRAQWRAVVSSNGSACSIKRQRPLVSHIVPRFAVVSLLVVEMTFWLSMQLGGVLRL